MVRLPRLLVLLLTIFILTVAEVPAAVIWSDDFTGQADGTFPSRDFNGNSVTDWAATSTPAMFTVSTSAGNPAPSMTFDDAATAGQGVMRLEMDEFSPFTTANPTTPLLQVSFDWKVEGFSIRKYERSVSGDPAREQLHADCESGRDRLQSRRSE
jgi:hypothetical protein